MAEVKYSSFRWFVLVSMVITVATSSLSLISPAPLIGPMIKSMPYLNPGQVVMMTMGIFNLFVAIGCIGGGFLLDKFGVVKVYLAGVLLIIIGEALVPLIGMSMWGMIFIRLLEGFGTGPIMSAGARIAADYFPHKERALVNGFTGFSVSGGIAIGLVLVPAIFKATGSWTAALTWLAPLGILAIILNIIVAAGPKPPAVEQPLVGEPGKVGNLMESFKIPTTYFLIFFVLILSWLFQEFNDITPGYIALKAPVGLGKGPAGASLLVAAQFTFMLGALVTGPINDKLFKSNIKVSLIIAFILGGLLSLTMLMPSITSHNGLFATLLALASFFFGWINPLVFAYISRNYPLHLTGKLGGLTQGVGIVGGFLGPTIGGAFLSSTGFYIVPICLLAGLSILAGLIAFVPKTRNVGVAVDSSTATA